MFGDRYLHDRWLDRLEKMVDNPTAAITDNSNFGWQ